MADTTIYSSASDGYLGKNSFISYNDAWAATIGAAYTSGELYVGQALAGGGLEYGVYRSAVFFDTSSIPSDAEISLVTLNLRGMSDFSTQDFNITVQNGMPYYPHDPLVEGDYDKSNYTGDGGQLSTVGFTTSGYNTITLNEDGIGWINKGGWTKLLLRSDRDIVGAEPSGGEYVGVYANEEAGKQPYLYIEYTVEGSEDTGATLPGTGENVDAGNLDWGLPNRITINNDDFYAYCDLPADPVVGYTDFLRGSNFGFSIPFVARIAGVKVDVRAKGATTVPKIYQLSLRNDTTLLGNAKTVSQALTTSFANYSFGGASDLWGATLTYNILNSSAFGVYLVGSKNSSDAAAPCIQYIKVTVYYTPLVTDWATPAACFSVSRTGSAIGWTNPSYVSTSDDSHTTAVVPKSGYTDWLRATQFGFTSILPFQATPMGIDVKIERKAEIADNLCDSSLRIRKTAGQTGDDGASDTKWGTTDAEITHYISFAPGALSYDDVASDDFGIDLSVLNDADAITTAYVDCISVRIHYYPYEVSILPITIQEYYNTGDDRQSRIFRSIWMAQTFTPATTHKITSVKLRLFRYATPGTITVSIRATDDGKPTGSDLCSGTTDGDTLPTGSPYEWREIALGAGYQLSASIKYALVVRALTPVGNSYTFWRYDYTGDYKPGDPAAGESAYSYDSGSAWTLRSAYDQMFEEWGQVGDPSTGGKILLETDDALLQEDDFYLLLEYIGGAGYYRIISAGLTTTATVARKIAIDRTVAAATTLSAAISRVFGRHRTTASSLNLSATVARKAAWDRTVSSAINLTAIIATTIGAISKYFVTIASNLNLSATIVRNIAVERATASSLTLSATISAIKGFGRTVASNLSLTATVSRTAAFTRAISSGLDLAATIVMTAVGRLVRIVTAMGNASVVKPVEGSIYAMKTAVGNVFSMKVIESSIYKLKTAMGRIYRMIKEE